jgi:hypothetical protein
VKAEILPLTGAGAAHMQVIPGQFKMVGLTSLKFWLFAVFSIRRSEITVRIYLTLILFWLLGQLCFRRSDISFNSVTFPFTLNGKCTSHFEIAVRY